MSIKLMSAIFETEFYDLILPEPDKEGKERKLKASTAKLVLLAIADHANDEGESAYPGLTRLERKTALSRQGIVDAISALQYNGILSIADTPSKLHTNNYTINLASFPSLREDFEGSQATLLVKPLDYPSQATLPEVVKPLDLNHHITINKPSSPSKILGLEASIAMGRPTTQEDLDTPEMVARRELQTFIEAMKLNPNLDAPEWERFGRFLREQRLSGKPQEKYTAWFRSDAFRYKNIGSWSPDGIKGRYSFKVTWPQAFEVNQPIRATGEHLL